MTAIAKEVGNQMAPYDFEKFFDYSLDMLCIAGMDGYFKRVNTAFERTLGWTIEELTSRPFIDFVHPDDVDATLQEVNKLASGLPTTSFSNRYRCSNGGYRHLKWTAFPEPETGLLFAVAHDATDLVEAKQRFQLAIDASPAALIMVDQHGLIRLVNREAERLFAYPPEFLDGRPIETLVPAELHVQHQRDRAAFFHQPSTRSMGAGRLVQAVRRDGKAFPAEIGLNPVQLSDGPYVLCAVVDLTLQKQVEERMIQLAQELEQANARLAQLAVTDRLTNTLNRRAFDEQLDAQVHLMHRMARPLSLLMIDLDHFKQYNDQHGHPAGDEVLQIAASLLQQNARATDVVARYGGEEFAIILPDTAEAGSLQMAERFRLAIQAHSWDQEPLTVSIGAATLVPAKLAGRMPANAGARLLAEADRALYFSKRNGRNQANHAGGVRDADPPP